MKNKNVLWVSYLKFIFVNLTIFRLLLRAWCFISCVCLWSLFNILSALGFASYFSSILFILILLSLSESLPYFSLIFKTLWSTANAYIRMEIFFLPITKWIISIMISQIFLLLKVFKISSSFVKVLYVSSLGLNNVSFLFLFKHSL